MGLYSRQALAAFLQETFFLSVWWKSTVDILWQRGCNSIEEKVMILPHTVLPY
jgi:hypothetical protein